VTDRELLEAAARAAGIELRWWSHLRLNGEDLEPKCAHIGNVVWNPLTDDGDALRLAVKLGQLKMIDLYLGRTFANVDFDDGSEHCYENHSADPYAATRRAIVRAAASIGAHSPEEGTKP
jgi:hypothetical protein